MTLRDGSLQNEWAPGRMGAQNGDIELGKFKPNHFSTLYIHINQSMPKKKIIKKKLLKDVRHRLNRRVSLYFAKVPSFSLFSTM